MASSKKAGSARRRGIPVALKVLALCLIALVALLILLPAPPNNKSGGVTTVTRHVPALRDTVDPLAKDFPRTVRAPAPEPAPVALPPPPAALPAPAPAPPPLPVHKPPIESARAPAPVPDWSRQIQAPPQQQTQDVARLPVEPAPETTPGRSAGLPSKSEIREWVKSQAWEFLGGVDAQGNILYRFEVWLDAPQKVLSSIDSVTYEYDAPSATPKTRESNQVNGGFRARFGSLACSKEVTVTLKMTGGGTRRAVVDGCRALN